MTACIEMLSSRYRRTYSIEHGISPFMRSGGTLPNVKGVTSAVEARVGNRTMVIMQLQEVGAY